MMAVGPTETEYCTPHTRCVDEFAKGFKVTVLPEIMTTVVFVGRYTCCWPKSEVRVMLPFPAITGSLNVRTMFDVNDAIVVFAGTVLISIGGETSIIAVEY